MSGWRDRFGKMMGRTRFVVCRIFIHLAGDEIAPLLGVLNREKREAIETDGDIKFMREGLVKICESLLQYDTYWKSAANEGNVFWDEGEAGDEFNYLFTDSAERYLSGDPDLNSPIPNANDPLYLPATKNLVVMISVAFEGEIPELETDLAQISSLKQGLKALINLAYKEESLRAIQMQWAPAQFGDELTEDNLLEHFSELIPL